jgi:hypothetical protein
LAIDRDLIFEARGEALREANWYAAAQIPDATPEQVERIADRWLAWLLTPTAVLRVRVSKMTFSLTEPGTYRPTTFTNLGGGQVAVTMQDNEYVTLSSAATDAEGNPTADTGLTWAVDQPTLATLVPSADGTQVNVGAAGPLGTVNVTLTDAAGNVSPADPITIVSGPATSLGISAGTPAVIPSTGVPVPAGAAG